MSLRPRWLKLNSHSRTGAKSHSTQFSEYKCKINYRCEFRKNWKMCSRGKSGGPGAVKLARLIISTGTLNLGTHSPDSEYEFPPTRDPSASQAPMWALCSSCGMFVVCVISKVRFPYLPCKYRIKIELRVKATDIAKMLIKYIRLL